MFTFLTAPPFSQPGGPPRQPRRQKPTRVLVIGGGIAGMNVAHELAERGFCVTVCDAGKVPGGKARSCFVPGTGQTGRRDLPSEHGFRFFPSFYRHLPHTMSRIPFGRNSQGVLDNLVATDRTALLHTHGAGFDSLTHFPRTCQEWQELFSPRTGIAREIPLEGRALFLRRVLRFLISCNQRRLAEYEKITYWDYFEMS